jgi:hypothetical protein
MHLLVLVLVWVATSIIKINLWDGHLARLGIKNGCFPWGGGCFLL